MCVFPIYLYKTSIMCIYTDISMWSQESVGFLLLQFDLWAQHRGWVLWNCLQSTCAGVTHSKRDHNELEMYCASLRTQAVERGLTSHVLSNKRPPSRDAALSVTVPCFLLLAVAVQVSWTPVLQLRVCPPQIHKHTSTHLHRDYFGGPFTKPLER